MKEQGGLHTQTALPLRVIFSLNILFWLLSELIDFDIRNIVTKTFFEKLKITYLQKFST